jgi:protein MAK11
VKLLSNILITWYRVKATQTLEIALPESSGRLSTTLVCTVSSDGFIKIYDLASVPSPLTQKADIEPLVSYDSKGTRFTCVTFADGAMESVAGLSEDGKRKRDDNDHGHADEDEDSEGDDIEVAVDEDEEVDEELEDDDVDKQEGGEESS